MKNLIWFVFRLRLGFDVFEKKEISEMKTSMLLNTIRSFKYLMDAYRVTNFKAAATSAMRDARNGPEIIETVEECHRNSNRNHQW